MRSFFTSLTLALLFSASLCSYSTLPLTEQPPQCDVPPSISNEPSQCSSKTSSKWNFLNACRINPKNHHFYIGPEVYFLRRTKKGGSKQKGWLYGVRGTYERLPWEEGGFYWAVDGGWAKGTLTGHTGAGRKLKSHLKDIQIEGRLGYAFSFSRCPRLLFVPYGGYGYLRSKNAFVKPSAIPFTFRDSFDYGTLGIFNWWFVSPCLKVGLHLKTAWMVDAKCRVFHDPEYGRVTLNIGHKNQYEIELPLYYQTCYKEKQITLFFAPFYRFRHLGFFANHPFDHIDTRFQLYGAKAQIVFIF